MSTRAPIHRHGGPQSRRLARRLMRRRLVRWRWFRGVRIGVLLAAIALIQLGQSLRPRWRFVVGVTGFLVEVVGFNVFSGGAQEISSVLGMGLLLFALMKDARQCSSRLVAIPQVMRPPC